MDQMFLMDQNDLWAFQLLLLHLIPGTVSSLRRRTNLILILMLLFCYVFVFIVSSVYYFDDSPSVVVQQLRTYGKV